MNAKSKIHRLNVLSVSLLLAFATGQGFAGDAKVYPGSMAVRWSGTSTPSYYASAVGNPSASQWLYVDLPVINDSMAEHVHSSSVRVVDRHYSSNVRCSLNSVYWNSTTGTMWGYWGSTKSSSGSSDGLQYLSTGSSSGAGSTYHQYFSCAIPPAYYGHRSYIVSYYVNED